jgi:hypothetical protein
MSATSTLGTKSGILEEVLLYNEKTQLGLFIFLLRGSEENGD